MQRENRAAPRFQIKRRIRAHELFTPGTSRKGNGVIRGRIQNISRGGLCLQTDQVMRKNSPVLCEIQLSKFPLSVPTLLEVCWAQENPKGGKHAAGLRFLL